ncbi:MAG: hypothetical protein ABIA04_07995 [Pseudomonadota bacterium]
MKRFLILLIVLISSCGNISNWDNMTYDARYESACIDAELRQEEEIANTLTAIVSDNTNLTWFDSNSEESLLVTTFTNYPDSYPIAETLETWWGETWVTVAFELKDKILAENISQESYHQRIIEILGLPPDSTQEYIVEFWVNIDDLFRPSPDPEITDNVAQLTFDDSTTEEHITWFENQENEAFEEDICYPWTGLGYTYDWGKEDSDFGLSEFIVRQNSIITVYSNSHYSEYFISETSVLHTDL